MGKRTFAFVVTFFVLLLLSACIPDLTQTAQPAPSVNVSVVPSATPDGGAANKPGTPDQAMCISGDYPFSLDLGTDQPIAIAPYERLRIDADFSYQGKTYQAGNFIAPAKGQKELDVQVSGIATVTLQSQCNNLGG